jgi:hypothetical protein
MALNIFQIIKAQGVSNLTRAITYGLASTIHARNIAHHLETENLKHDNATLQQQLNALTTIQAAQENGGLGAEIPKGYIENQGYISHLIPVEEGLLIWAKWVKLQNNRAVELLSGRSRDKEPYITNIYASPNYDTETPIEPLPSWFYYLINGLAPKYHTFCNAMGRLDKWEYPAEVEHLCRYTEKQHKICDEVKMLNAELQYMDDKFAACCHRIKATRIPEMVHGFDQHPTRPHYCGLYKRGRGKGRFQLLNKSGDPF